MALVLRDVALLHTGPAISLRVESGQTLCIVGPSGSGKTRLVRFLAGQETPDRGEIQRPQQVAMPEPCNRKLRPQDLSHRRGENRAVLATEVLSQLGLWDARQRPIGELPAGLVAACELVEPLMSQAELLIFDESLDRLDPWSRAGALRLIRDRCNDGAVCIVATNLADMASQFDYLIALKDSQPVYAGPVPELVATRGQRSLTIESEYNTGVRALVQPLLVGVSRTERGYHLQPGPGQEQTAKLLREGYGDVKFMVTDQKSVEEIVLELIL
ncbi:MAG TPA: ATP-binding cassette domain-containing protein [Fimbriimonadaceae bacterium]|nr:ATP-binding cassette domain-containing protein [Fimbriimonadaceae bacterium]